MHVDQPEKAEVAQCTGHGPWSQATDEVAEPAQLAPPLNGAGLSQVRVPDFVPAPQLVEQVPYVQPDQTPSTGHAWVLQSRDEVAEEPSAVHSAPFTNALWNGAGLVHVRELVCVPVPHDLVQVDQAVNVVWTQSTGHAWALQVRVSAECGQATPPADGATVARLRFCEPVPHDLVQVDQAAQLLVTQSTGHELSLQARVSS